MKERTDCQVTQITTETREKLATINDSNNPREFHCLN